jgi:predicted amidophosphoribosyltransferase
MGVSLQPFGKKVKRSTPTETCDWCDAPTPRPKDQHLVNFGTKTYWICSKCLTEQNQAEGICEGCPTPTEPDCSACPKYAEHEPWGVE